MYIIPFAYSTTTTIIGLIILGVALAIVYHALMFG
jgi:hypothetical protein